MLRKLRTKRAMTALSVTLVLAVAATAFAYFSSSGSGSSTASVGSASALTVSVASPTGGPLYPGSGTQSFSYTITNPASGTGSQHLNGAVASIASDATSGDILNGSGAIVTGCKASWFTVDNSGAPAATTLAPSGSTTGSAIVSLTNQSVSQDACQGAAPKLTVATN